MANIITGTEGSDTITGTTGDDTISTLGGSDYIYVSRGVDTIDAGAGYDYMFVDAAGSTLALGNVARTITLTTGRVRDAAGLFDTSFSNVETIYIQDSSANALTVDASGFTNTIAGTSYGMTAVLMGSGNRTVTGSAAADTIYLGTGVNVVDAGAGNDYVSVQVASQNGQVTITQNGAATLFRQNGQTIDTITNAETIGFSNANAAYGFNIDASAVSRAFSFFGTTQNDILIGGSGNDVFTISGNGTDTDTITTGAGADFVGAPRFSTLAANTIVTDLSTSDQLTFNGVAANESFVPKWLGTGAFTNAAGQYRYATANGQTVIQFDIDGNGTSDRTITLSNGAWTLAETSAGSNVLQITGAFGANVITGTAAANTLRGTLAADTINALGGNDTIYLSQGQDTIDGGTGTDRLILTPTDPSLFANAGSIAQSYTVTASRISNTSGTLDTSFTNIEQLTLTDLRAGNSNVDISAFQSGTNATNFISLGDGDHVVKGGNGRDAITVGIGSSTIDGGALPSSVTLNIDGAASDPALITYAGGTYGVSYTSGGVLRSSTVTGGTLHVGSGAAHGLFADAGAIVSANQVVGYTVAANGSVVPTYAEFGVWFTDSNYDDVLVGSRTADRFASGGSGKTTVNGGTDTLTGNGGADAFDYGLVIGNIRGDHILDLDSDDILDFSYYSDPANDYVDPDEPTWLGTGAFTGGRNQIRYETRDGKTYIQTDLDGDKVVDGTLTIENGAFTLVAANAGYPNQFKINLAQNFVTGDDTAQNLGGTAGNDVIRAYGGNDVIVATRGQDFVDGGKGVNELLATIGAARQFNAPTAAQTYTIGADRIVSTGGTIDTAFLNIQKVTLITAGNYGDTIDGRGFGGSLNLTLGTGNDRVTGTAQDDRIAIGGGRDVVDGGAGADTLVLSGTRAANTMVNLGNGRIALVAASNTVIATNVETVQFADQSAAVPALLANVAVFDALRYIASNADLARGFGADANLGIDHYVNAGLAEGRATTGFDPLRYLASNADLARGFGADATAATVHYIRYGLAEGRATASFDPYEYLASNLDLARGFGADADAATRHYVTNGLAEGRATASFDAWGYLASNLDLARGFGPDPSAAARHYVSYGLAEGRVTNSFDAYLYLASNPDLARGFGPDPVAAERHYVQFGLAEGRAIASFDPVAYLAANADLAAAFRYDPAAAERHYVQFGLGENRATGGFDATAYLLSNADLGGAGLTSGSAFVHWITNGAAEGRSGDAAYGREQAGHALALGTPLADALQTGGDRDWFAVTLAQGQHVSIGMQANGFAPTVALADEHGVQRAIAALSTGSTATIDFTADHAATYYLTASSTGGIAGGYQLDVHTI